MTGRRKIAIACCLFLAGLSWLTGCGGPSSHFAENKDNSGKTAVGDSLTQKVRWNCSMQKIFQLIIMKADINY